MFCLDLKTVIIQPTTSRFLFENRMLAIWWTHGFSFVSESNIFSFLFLRLLNYSLFFSKGYISDCLAPKSFKQFFKTMTLIVRFRACDKICFLLFQSKINMHLICLTRKWASPVKLPSAKRFLIFRG